MATRSLNKVQLIGNLTRDPELRYTPQGTAVCNFGVATNRQWTTEEGNRREEAEFHTIVAWNKLAEICAEFLNKGKQVYIEGRLSTREWEAQDGSKRKTTEIIANEVIFLGGPGRPAEELDIPEELGTDESGEETAAGEDKKASASSGKSKKKGNKAKKEEKAEKKEEDNEDIPF